MKPNLVRLDDGRTFVWAPTMLGPKANKPSKVLCDVWERTDAGDKPIGRIRKVEGMRQWTVHPNFYCGRIAAGDQGLGAASTRARAIKCLANVKLPIGARRTG